MQSKIIEKEVEKKVKYPCLMKSKKHGYVVLFTDLGNGVVVHPGTSSWKLGQSCRFFEMNYFTPFNGTIELSNTMKLEIKDIEEQKEKKFHPFKIEMLIENEDDLLDLWARFNFHTYAVNSMLSEGEKKSIPEDFENVIKWKFIDNLLKNKPYMK